MFPVVSGDTDVQGGNIFYHEDTGETIKTLKY